MEDKYYTIGQFAIINKVSTRMLRHYHKMGLLVPAHVDANGYRYYDKKQVELINLIKRYRECQFSIKEISKILEGKDISDLVSNKISEIENKNNYNEDSLRRLKEMNFQEAEEFINNYDISITNRKAVTLLTNEEIINEESIEGEFDNLYEVVMSNNLLRSGVTTLISYMDNINGFKVGIPIAKATNIKNYELLKFSEGNYLSTVYFGEYYNLSYAYNAIFTFAERNNYKIDTVFLERYFLDSTHTNNSKEYITEISVKIIENTP